MKDFFVDQVFGGNSGTSVNTGTISQNSSSTTTNKALASALASAQAALADANAALTKGDFAAYGRAQDRLKAAIAAAIAAQRN